MPDETPATRAPTLASDLAAFNAERRIILGGKPINPEGEDALMSEEERARANGG